MKLYGFSIGVNIHARTDQKAQEYMDKLLETLRLDSAITVAGVSVDSAEAVGEVEELE